MRSAVRCYGANEMREGVAIMIHEHVDISISGNATNMIRFQHPVGGAYKKYCNDNNIRYFACASGGGIGRTLNPDDTSAGPSSYGQTDLMARMYADATFAGSSSVPAHVEMMGFVGMGNNLRNSLNEILMFTKGDIYLANTVHETEIVPLKG